MQGSVVSCAIECSARSMERLTLVEITRLRRGLTSLEAIAWLSPMLGAFESAREALWWLDVLPYWCRGGDCAGGIADCLVPIILSLPVGMFAYTLLVVLRRWAASLEVEMRAGVLETLNGLQHLGTAAPR